MDSVHYVLLVEDSPSDAELFRCMLDRCCPDANLTHVSRLAEAISQLVGDDFDAVLLDLQLPDSSGLDTLHRIYEHARGMPIVVLTTTDDPAQAVEAVKAGAEDYITKDTANGENLARCLRYAVERRKLKAALEHREAELSRLSRLITAGELASTVAHEVKQPLAAISGYAEACLNRLESENNNGDRVVENLRAIAEQVSHAAAVVERIRSYIGKCEPVRAPTSVNTVIQNAVRMLAAEARRRGVKIVLQLQPDLPQVVADPVQLQQVVLNLLQNGLDAAGQSASATPQIRISTSDDTALREIRITVSDNGPGIDPDQRKRVFEPLFSTKEGGMGMGLPICQRLLAAHDGRIEVGVSEEGGAEFTVGLPVQGKPLRADGESG